MMPNPDASIDASDRATFLGLYHGITLNGPSIIDVLRGAIQKAIKGAARAAIGGIRG